MNKRIKKFYNQSKSEIILVLLFFFAILDFLFFKIFIESASDFILFITFLAVLWYSYETKKLKEETSSQKHLNVYPFLVLIEYNEGLCIVNIGRGPAMWPEVETEGDFTIATPSFLYSRVIPTIFDDANARIPLLHISTGEEERSEEHQQKKERIENTKLTTINNKNLFKNGKIILKYRDIYGKMYISKIRLTPVGPYLEEYKF